MKYILLSILFIAIQAQSNPANDEALINTQNLLKDQNQINQVIQNDSKAKQADIFADKAVGDDPKLKEKLNNITADAFGSLQKAANGDPDKMQKILEKALQNPESFYEVLSAEDRNKIRDLASEIDSKKSAPAVKP